MNIQVARRAYGICRALLNLATAALFPSAAYPFELVPAMVFIIPPNGPMHRLGNYQENIQVIGFVGC